MPPEKPVEEVDGIDHESTDVPVCPFCGHEDMQRHDDANMRKECWSVWCGSCSREYDVSVHITYSFTTRKP